MQLLHRLEVHTLPSRHRQRRGYIDEGRPDATVRGAQASPGHVRGTRQRIQRERAIEEPSGPSQLPMAYGGLGLLRQGHRIGRRGVGRLVGGHSAGQIAGRGGPELRIGEHRLEQRCRFGSR